VLNHNIFEERKNNDDTLVPVVNEIKHSEVSLVKIAEQGHVSNITASHTASAVLSVGHSINCNANDPSGYSVTGGPNGGGTTIYRYLGNGILAEYQNPSIAYSWDRNWLSPITINCTGYSASSVLKFYEPQFFIIITKMSLKDIRPGRIEISLFKNTQKIQTSVTVTSEMPGNKVKIQSQFFFNHVIVRNRADCCQEDIVGSIIIGTYDKGCSWFLNSTFNHVDDVYFFSARKTFVQITKPAAIENRQIINLGEVSLLQNGHSLQPSLLQCIVSDRHQAECADGKNHPFCHSEGLPYLVVFSQQPFDSVSVVNRQDCCKERIVGATIRATVDGGKTWSLHQTFKETAEIYNFTLENFVLDMPVGSPLNCYSNDPNGFSSTGGPNGGGATVYRYMGNGILAPYKSPDIAHSWDRNWDKPVTVNCAGYKAGSALDHYHSANQ